MFNEDAVALRNLTRTLTGGRVTLGMADIYYDRDRYTNRVGYFADTNADPANMRLGQIIFPTHVPETVLIPEHAMLVFMDVAKPPMRPAKLRHWEAMVVEYIEKHFPHYLSEPA